MEYVIPLALVLVVITAVIVLLVQRTASKGSARAEDAPDDSPGIGADEASPFGDTTEHSDALESEGTPTGTGGGRFSRAGRRSGARDAEDDEMAAHIQRPGEGEGTTGI